MLIAPCSKKSRGWKVEERLGFGRGNSEIIEGVTKMEVWVAFYRGKVTFWLAMVGEGVNAGVMEVLMK